MPHATWIALGATALGLLVFAFSIVVSMSASKKKAARQASQADAGET